VLVLVPVLGFVLGFVFVFVFVALVLGCGRCMTFRGLEGNGDTMGKVTKEK
jgi:hypothetical protein